MQSIDMKSTSLGLSKRLRVGCSLMMLAAASAGAIAGPPRPMAVSGTDGPLGPGLGAGVVFTTFYADEYFSANPVMNNKGDSIFIATISGPGITLDNDTGIWIYRNGQLSVLAHEGDQAIDQPAGIVYSRFGTSDSYFHYAFEANISETGGAAFKVGLRGMGIDALNDDTLYTEASGQLHLAIQEGVTALPGYPGISFGNADGVREEFWWGSYINLRDDGRFMIRSRVFPRGFQNNDWDVIVDDLSGTLNTFYRGNMPMPGYPSSRFFTTSFPFLTGTGLYTHWERHTDAAALGFEQSTWSNRNGTREMIYREGIPLPGGRMMLGAPMPKSINSSGAIAFHSTTDIYGEDFDLRTEGFFGIPIQLVAIGDPAPGAGPGAVFDVLSNATPLIADNGATIFHTSLKLGFGGVTPATDRGIWSNRSGFTLTIEAREGDVAPGSTGLVFTEFQAIFLNADARIAFVAKTDDGQRGIWRQDTPGSYSKIAKAFDFTNLWDVMGDGSNQQLIADINMWGGTNSYTPINWSTTSDGRRTPYNDAGDMVFRLSFIDGSEGVYTTSPASANPCLADMTGDGMLNFFDVSAFLSAFSASDPSADFTGDGQFNFFDVSAFLQAFSAGCP